MARRALLILLLVTTGCDGCYEPLEDRTAPSSTTVSPERPALTSEFHVASADRRCRASCKLGGLCGWDDELGRCAARSEVDCHKSDSCLTSGLCQFEKGLCVGKSDADCAQSEQCKAAGRCSFTGKGLRPCEARTPADCEASTMCRRKGECTPAGGRCRVMSVRDCERSEACTKHGLCSVKEIAMGAKSINRCTALRDADCLKSEGCTERGLCVAVSGGCQ